MSMAVRTGTHDVCVSRDCKVVYKSFECIARCTYTMTRRPGDIAVGLVLLLMCGGQVEAACNTDATVFDCNTYNPHLCTPDLTPFCLTNGTKVSGSCEAKQAVCVEHAFLDNTNVACDPTATTAAPSHENLLDCVCYNQTGLCRQDLHVFCLDNGTTIFGSCSALKAVCHERATLGRCGDSAAASLLTSTFLVGPLIAVCVTAWGIIK